MYLLDWYWWGIFFRCLIFVLGNFSFFLLTLKLISRHTQWDSMHQLLAASIIGYAVVVFGFFTVSLLAAVTPAAILAYLIVVLIGEGFGAFCVKNTEGALKAFVSDRSVTLYLIILAVFVSVAIHFALSRLPVDMDSLNYHIPLPVNWIQSKSLFSPQCMHWSCPGNNELIGCWLIIFFESDFLIGLNNLPSIGILILAVFQCLRQIGFSMMPAFSLTLMALGNEVILRQVCDQENDVAVAAFFLSSVLYGIRFFSKGKIADLIICGVAFGLLGGVKYYALGYSCLLGSVFSYFALRKNWVAIWLAIMVFILSFLAFAAYWYLRNYFGGGMFLYPFSFFKEHDLSRRAYPALDSSSIWGNGVISMMPSYLAAIMKFIGPAYVLSVLLVPIIGLLAVLRIGYSRRTRPAALYRLLLQLGALGIFVITPFAVEDEPGTQNQMQLGYCPVRYSLPFLLLSFLNACCLSRVGLYAAYRVLKKRCQLRFGAAKSCGNGWLKNIWIIAFCILPILGGCIQGARTNLFGRDELIAVACYCVLLWLMIYLLRIFQGFGGRRLVPASRLLIFGVLSVFCFFFSINGYDWEEKFRRHYQHTYGIGITRFIYNHKNGGLKIGVFTYPEYGYYGGSRKVVLMQPYFLADDLIFLKYLRDNEIDLCIGAPNAVYLEGSPFRVANRVIKKWPFLFSPLTLDRRSSILYRVNYVYFEPALVFNRFQQFAFPFAGVWELMGKNEADALKAWIRDRVLEFVAKQ